MQMGTSSPFTRVLIVGKSLGPKYVPISNFLNAEVSLIALITSGVAFNTLKVLLSTYQTEVMLQIFTSYPTYVRWHETQITVWN